MGKIFNSRDYLGANKKDYFEGWYFRHSTDCPFAFIVGVSKSSLDRHSFIQYIDGNMSHYFRFNESDFCYNKQNMTISIGCNVFSLNGICVNLVDGALTIKADLKFSHMTEFKKSVYAPSVMGPFAYIPMFCNHAIISMRHDVVGELEINGVHKNTVGLGYIEKDFGSKFPENYFWVHVFGEDLSIMCAVAWPLVLNMKGFLCIVLYKGVQYNFSLYSGAAIKKFELSGDRVELQIDKGKSSLSLSAQSGERAQKLIAPNKKGSMTIEIAENLCAELQLHLIIGGREISVDEVKVCAFESVLQ